MAGIYIHIPFCKQACYYCDFHFSTSLKHKDELIDGIVKEIGIRKKDWENETFETIYFGGGTPSIVDVKDIGKILNTLQNAFDIKAKEITLEGNPDDLTLDKMLAYKYMGINRLSIGVQSFFDEDLSKLNRSHNARQALKVLENTQKAGFDNVTLDLIYGIPGLSNQRWLKNINTALSFGIPHLSAYALTVEENTVLSYLIKKKKFAPVKDSQSAEQFEILRNVLLNKGFEHYEVSNFAKKGFQSRHNRLYWQNIPYLGLGPSAHSFKDTKRSWNISNNSIYLKKLDTGDFFEEEILTERDIYNEKLLTGLRTAKGVELRNFTEQEKNILLQKAQVFIDKNLLVIEKGYLKPTSDSLFIIEGIIVDLFMEED